MRSRKEHPFDSEADKVRWDQTDRNFSRFSIIDIIVHFFWWVGRAMLGILIFFFFWTQASLQKEKYIPFPPHACVHPRLLVQEGLFQILSQPASVLKRPAREHQKSCSLYILSLKNSKRPCLCSYRASIIADVVLFMWNRFRRGLRGQNDWKTSLLERKRSREANNYILLKQRKLAFIDMPRTCHMLFS